MRVRSSTRGETHVSVPLKLWPGNDSTVSSTDCPTLTRDTCDSGMFTVAQSTVVSVRVNRTSASSTTAPWTAVRSTISPFEGRPKLENSGRTLLTGKCLYLGLVKPEHQQPLVRLSHGRGRYVLRRLGLLIVLF